VQYAGFPHEIVADLTGLHELGQLLIERAGERQGSVSDRAIEVGRVKRHYR
jgi:hypothetical protein